MAATMGAATLHRQRGAPPLVPRTVLPGRQATGSFSVLVLADPDDPLTARIDATLHEVGARDIRYAASPADLMRSLPLATETGVGVICRSLHSDAVLQLVAQLRSRGWRRIVLACDDGDEAAVRLAIKAKVRCLIRRPDSWAPQARHPGDAVWHGVVRGAAELSRREVQVLQAVADGHTNNEIGDLLGLSGLTVKSHLARIGRKTGTGDRAEMVAIAMRAGLVA